MRSTHLAIIVAVASLAGSSPSLAQGSCAAANDTVDHAHMDHAAHQAMMAACAQPLPTMPGQAAFGAIREVVRLLEADPATDWSRVNIEALRQHLIDMDEVTMHAEARQRNIPGGAEIDVTGGAARTQAAIERMVVNHGQMLDKGATYHVTTATIPGGVRMTVTAKDGADARTVAKIRGLGFAGLLTEGDHHAAHHMAIAMGKGMGM